MSDTAIVALIVMYTVAGTAFIVWPASLQRLILRLDHGETGRFSRLAGVIRSPKYIVLLRVVGVLSATAALTLTLLLLDRLSGGI